MARLRYAAIIKMNLQIRRATLDDAEMIVRMNAALAEETEHLELNPQRLMHGVQAVLQDCSKGFYTVAEVERLIVGQMMVTFEWSDWRNATIWWVQSVYVRPEYRRRGIYKKLYNTLFVEAESRKEIGGLRLYVSNENTSAQEVYQRLGLRKSHYDLYEIDFVLER